MSHQAYIDYLNSVKAANTAKISTNESTISSIDEITSDLETQILSYQGQKTGLQAANTQLVADNQTIDDIIALL